MSDPETGTSASHAAPISEPMLPSGKPGLLGSHRPSSLFSEPEVSPRTVTILRILNPLAFLAVAVINGLSSSGTLGGRTNGEVSDTYTTPITPAGYAFSIWGLIYLFQAALFLVYQFLPFANKGLVFHRIGYWHLGLCVGNIAWTFAFAYEQLILQCVIIWAMLACLATIYMRIYVHSGLSTDAIRAARTWMEYFFVYVPWALYTSWLVGACIISTFIASGVKREESVYAGMAAMAAAAFVNIMILAWTRDVWFAGVNVWTLIAIANNQGDLEQIWSSAIVLAAVVGACAAAAWVKCLVDLVLRIRGNHSKHETFEENASTSA